MVLIEFAPAAKQPVTLLVIQQTLSVTLCFHREQGGTFNVNVGYIQKDVFTSGNAFGEKTEDSACFKRVYEASSDMVPIFFFLVFHVDIISELEVGKKCKDLSGYLSHRFLKHYRFLDVGCDLKAEEDYFKFRNKHYHIIL